MRNRAREGERRKGARRVKKFDTPLGFADFAAATVADPSGFKPLWKSYCNSSVTISRYIRCHFRRLTPFPCSARDLLPSPPFCPRFMKRRRGEIKNVPTLCTRYCPFINVPDYKSERVVNEAYVFLLYALFRA